MKNILLLILAGLLLCLCGCAMFETPVTWLDNAPKLVPEKTPAPKPAASRN